MLQTRLPFHRLDSLIGLRILSRVITDIPFPLFVLLLFSSCGGGGSAVSPPPVNPGSFQLSVSPNTAALTPGSSQVFSVVAEPSGNFDNIVTVSVQSLPTGMSISPTQVSMSPGVAKTFTLSAASNLSIGQYQASLKGTSGSLQSTSSVSVNVVAQARVISRPLTNLGGDVERAFLDEKRGLLFVTNPGRNEVDVLSAGSLAVLKKIDIPAPFGIDQMVDAKTLVVGTFTKAIYTIDEDTFAVSVHWAPDFGRNWQTEVLLDPVAMANGRVLLISQIVGVYVSYIYGGQYILEWDSATDTFTDITPAWGDIETLRRSGDHKSAVFVQDAIYLYNSETGTLTRKPSELGGRIAVPNNDGTQFLFSGHGYLTVLNSQLDSVGTYQARVDTPLPRFLYSTDGQFFYMEGVLNNVGDVLEVIDAHKLELVGLATIGTFKQVSATEPVLLAVSEEKTAYLAMEGGYIVTADCSIVKPAESIRYTPFMIPNPPAIPLNTEVPVTFQTWAGPTGGTYAFNGAAAKTDTADATQTHLTVTPPPSVVAGPVDVSLSLPDSSSFIGPGAFAYGSTILSVNSTWISPGQNARATVFGYGLLNSDSSLPVVTVGGQPVTNLSGGYNVERNALQHLQFDLPASLSGTVDITTANSLGNATLRDAQTYIPSSTIVPADGVLQVTYDERRKLLYVLKGNEVDVLDPVSRQWQTPLIPATAASGPFTHMVLSPDGSRIVVDNNLELLSSTFWLIDLEHSNAVTSHTGIVQGPLAIRYDNKLLGNRGSTAVLVDPDTLTLTQLLDPGVGTAPHFYDTTSDGSRVVGFQNGGSGYLWNADGSSLQVHLTDHLWADAAIRKDGSQIASIILSPTYLGGYVVLYDPKMHYLNRVVYPDVAQPVSSAVVGAAYSPAGKVLVIPGLSTIDFFDSETGRLIGRLTTPDTSIAFTGHLTGARKMALNESGTAIFLVCQSGVAILELPVALDEMHKFSWPLTKISSGLKSSVAGPSINKVAGAH